MNSSNNNYNNNIQDQDDDIEIEIPIDEIIIEEVDDDQLLDGESEIEIRTQPIDNNNNNSNNNNNGNNKIGDIYVSNPNTPRNNISLNKSIPISIGVGDTNQGNSNSNSSESIEDDGANEKVKKSKKDKKDGEKETENQDIVPFLALFKFADTTDKILMFFGALAAVINGAAMPTVSIVFGLVVDAFKPTKFNEDPDYDVYGTVRSISFYLLMLGGGVFVLSYLETTLWMISGERQSNKVRRQYLESTLRQEIGWFDTNKANELSSRINSDTVLYEEAIGEKVGRFIHFVATFIAGFVIGFTKGWQLTLVITSVSPLLAIGGFFTARMMTQMTKLGQDAYSRAGGVAEENISAIRTVATFSGENLAIDKYSENLKEARSVGYKRAFYNGLGIGFGQLVILGTYALAFWYGSTLISKKVINSVGGNPWTGGDVVAVFFSVIIGATSIGQASPCLAIFAQGRGAAFKIFQVIDRKSAANPFSTEGIKPEVLSGEIEFKNVGFHYPARPNNPIFKNFNLKIKPGQTIGLVGDSGGGKSTIISLLERFYDPSEGEILLDGEDIRNFNVKGLREKIGLVNQEPVLFATTISENIRYGKEGATQDEIEEAAKLANAHSFITQLPHGYNTLVGEKGVQMSGGQRQRIAIARAIIKNPNILLLDEATSALDDINERVVQEAIDMLMRGRTCIVIAHRLSTIRNADVIIYIRGGQVVETGSHDELMASQGLYYNLVEKQTQQQMYNLLDMNRSRRASTFSDVNPLLDSFHVSKRSIRKREPESSKKQKEEEEKKKKKKSEDIPMSRVINYNKGEYGLWFFGFLSAVGTGAVYPGFTMVFTEMLTIFQNPDPNYLTEHANFVALMFVALAVGAGISNFFQGFLFSVIGEKLTYRLRKDCFSSIMKQDIGWFDLQENSCGKLTSHLASDAALVQGMTSQRLGIVLQNLLTMLGGLAIAFYSGWQLTLVIIACFPLVIITSKIQMQILAGFSKNDGCGPAGQVASEAISGIRTVASFTTEKQVVELYKKQLKGPSREGIKKAHISGFAYGFTQLILFCTYCLSFWYGGKLVGSGVFHATSTEISNNCNDQTIPQLWNDYDVCVSAINTIYGFNAMTRVFFAIVMSAIGIGQASSFAPDLAKAKVAAISVFKLIDTLSKIDPSSEEGERINIVVGDMEFKNLHFAYPSRPDNNVFRGFSLAIPSGTTNAFVGDSGGGKSTILSLLLRFYNPAVGEIFIDGHNIRNLNVKHLRSLFGLVGQEPTLFSGTIADNIRYGKLDATQEEIEEAARLANAHTFITQFKDGYSTQLGDKYTQLSGGQKQRIAIARAIIRNPKILLLDEATSALDEDNSKLVQDALNNVMKGRTTLVIAHRLSTIQNADCIAYVRAGQIIEKGTHEELVENDGAYAQLSSRQLNH
ncbi:ABC transporter B family protein [Dictyostelium purpureum]|uniref:ABC transporter B family protein n=1 Tax=Dictyostelium purpureum TaxID=5786 RepID=F0ZR15_DICPU|nr:ABC transporter B family protein [Dictyostelium purpureum]EGC33591.1 ABC transporter B family protein [Dictyostelium purpureum]|eukprot:XP_003289859.1 ABC transporter B family protein [Dictyostelium purpureum]